MSITLCTTKTSKRCFKVKKSMQIANLSVTPCRRQQVTSSQLLGSYKYTNILSRYMVLAGKTEFEIGEPRITLGARVLAALPEQNTCNFLLEYYFEKCYDNRAYKRITLAICSSFWNTFGNEMKEPRCMEDLEKVSAAISKNVTIPLEESDDWETYVASFTGTHMRWEAVGCVFAGLSSALLALPERDGFFTTQRGARTDRKHFAVELKDCLQACMSLSNYMDFLNIIMVAITCRNMFLQTVLSGDTSTLLSIIVGS